MSTAATFFEGRLRIDPSGFAYAAKNYVFADVVGLEFKQQALTSRNGSAVATVYESYLQLLLKNGRKLTIRPEPDPRRRVRSTDKAVYDTMANVADWLAAYTFDARMDHYEAQAKAKGFVSWGKHQINLKGDLFYRHTFCLNLLDANVRCMLYPFHMACLPRPLTWWQKLLYAVLHNSEIVDLRRDRDCFLYFMRRRLNIAWPSETLRVYRGMPAEGIKDTPKAEVPPQKEARQEAPQSERPREETKREAPPPPPKPKTMATHVQHLATLGLGPDEPWDKVKARYRQLVRVHHPDLLRGKGAKDAAIKQAEETLKGINEAYAWLEDFYKLK